MTTAHQEYSLHTGLICLKLAGMHHGMELDERRLAHEYALSDGEPALRHLADIASGCGFREKISGRTGTGFSV